jgi:hypothetical protein
MNKRSAAIVAAGLVAVLTLGGFAFSRGLTGLGVGVATASERVSHSKPIVRTHTKRVVVHRSAPAPAPRIVYSQAPSTGSSTAVSSSSDNSSYEDSGGDYEDQGGYEDQEDQGGFEEGDDD